jgi:hypothetical protein
MACGWGAENAGEDVEVALYLMQEQRQAAPPPPIGAAAAVSPADFLSGANAPVTAAPLPRRDTSRL